MTRNWPQEKFLKIAYLLKESGYDPVFIPGKGNEEWKRFNLKIEEFDTLDSLSNYLYESGFFIGNDSGPWAFSFGSKDSNINDL